jgi:hypothetical protein
LGPIHCVKRFPDASPGLSRHWYCVHAAWRVSTMAPSGGGMAPCDVRSCVFGVARHKRPRNRPCCPNEGLSRRHLSRLHTDRLRPLDDRYRCKPRQHDGGVSNGAWIEHPRLHRPAQPKPKALQMDHVRLPNAGSGASASAKRCSAHYAVNFRFTWLSREDLTEGTSLMLRTLPFRASAPRSDLGYPAINRRGCFIV